MPTALIVHAHPEPESFCTAQMRVAAETLRESGYQVEVIDLHRVGWSPILDRHEFGMTDGMFKPQAEQLRALADGTLPADVKADLAKVLAADLLVLSFPLWWFTVPAILKGWVDRVFVMGAVFGGDLGIFDEAGLVGKRAMVLMTTGGTEAMFQSDGVLGAMDDFLFPIHRGMFEFVGYEVVPPVITHAPARITAAEREAALRKVRESFAALGQPRAMARSTSPA